MAAFESTIADVNRLLVTARNIEESLFKAEKALGNIEESFISSLIPSWSGEGSTAFLKKYNTDAQNISAMFNRFKVLNEQLKKAANVYEQAESESSSLVNSLNIG